MNPHHQVQPPGGGQSRLNDQNTDGHLPEVRFVHAHRRLAWPGVCFAALLLLAGLLLHASLFSYSNVRAESGPAPDPIPGHTAPDAQASGLTPFLTLVPTEDGADMLVSAGAGDELGGVVYANVGIGGASHKEGWTMTYSETVQSYLATVTGFTPTRSQEGRISITTTAGLATEDVEFTRAYVPNDGPQTVYAADGNMEIQIHNAETLPADTYMAIAPSYAPPGPAPAGRKLIGGVYSVRVAGAAIKSEKPFLLRLYYTDELLEGRDPETLAIYGWDGAADAWYALGGRLFADRRYVSVVTDHFTTYGLMGVEPVEVVLPDWFVEWWWALCR